MKIIVLNGPPHSGKDTIGTMLARCSDGVYLFKFANALKIMTHRALGLDGYYPDFFEESKDSVLPAFHSVTPREAYIAMSEGFAKPLFGQGYFGKRLADEIKQCLLRCHSIGTPMQYAVVTDGGFKHEVKELADEFGNENMLLCHIFKAGCSFTGDSRRYVRCSGIKKIDIDNGQSIKALRESLAQALGSVQSFKGLAERVRSGG